MRGAVFSGLALFRVLLIAVQINETAGAPRSERTAGLDYVVLQQSDDFPNCDARRQKCPDFVQLEARCAESFESCCDAQLDQVKCLALDCPNQFEEYFDDYGEDCDWPDVMPSDAPPIEVYYDSDDDYLRCMATQELCMESVDFVKRCEESFESCCNAQHDMLECAIDDCPNAYQQYYDHYGPDCRSPFEMPTDYPSDENPFEDNYDSMDDFLRCAAAQLLCMVDSDFEARCEESFTFCCDAQWDLLVCSASACPKQYEEYYEIVGESCGWPAELPSDDDDPVEGSGDGETSDGGCFYAYSRVHLQDGSVKSMEELEVGDRVQTGPDSFSEVFSWGHRDPTAHASFRRVHVGERHIEVTRSHYLPVNGKLVAAEFIKTGDFLQLGDGGEAEVTSVETVNLKGLYNPHTLDGQIVVNGLTASIYTRAVPPLLAHYLLAFPRLIYRLGLGDLLGSYLYGASPAISRIIPRGSTVYN